MQQVINETSPESFIFVGMQNAGSGATFDKSKFNYTRIIPFNHYTIVFTDTSEIKAHMFNKTDNKLVATYSTITSAIHLAHYMGAKNIILVGHDCCQLNNESNFTNYHTTDTRGLVWGTDKDAISKYNRWLGEIQDMTIHIKKILNTHYNVNVLSLNPFINFNLEGVKKS
jgi:hemoglobin-like flavoprotein